MMINALLLLVPIVIVGTAAATEDVADNAGVMSIFKTPAWLDIEFTTDDPFRTETIYQIEEVTTLYLRELLTNDDSLKFLEEPDSLIDVSVNVQMQQVNGNEISLGSKVDVVHYGEAGIPDVAALLTFLVNRNNTDSSSIYLDQLIQTDASIELITFDYISESIPVAFNLTTTAELYELKNSQDYANEKTLLVVTTLLSITLFGMSAILIWVGGGWLVLRKKVQDLLLREEEMTRMTMTKIESKPTKDTEDEENSPSRGNESSQFTNPSGILGVSRESRPNMYGNGTRTPVKMGVGMSASNLDTPMSVMSDYSDTNRAPIGIMSMRKLVPPRQQSSDDEDENDENMTSNHFNNMKNLQY